MLLRKFVLLSWVRRILEWFQAFCVSFIWPQAPRRRHRDYLKDLQDCLIATSPNAAVIQTLKNFAQIEDAISYAAAHNCAVIVVHFGASNDVTPFSRLLTSEDFVKQLSTHALYMFRQNERPDLAASLGIPPGGKETSLKIVLPMLFGVDFIRKLDRRFSPIPLPERTPAPVPQDMQEILFAQIHSISQTSDLIFLPCGFVCSYSTLIADDSPDYDTLQAQLICMLTDASEILTPWKEHMDTHQPRRLREQQDEEYAEALQKDREREQRLREETQERERAKELLLKQEREYQQKELEWKKGREALLEQYRAVPYIDDSSPGKFCKIRMRVGPPADCNVIFRVREEVKMTELLSVATLIDLILGDCGPLGAEIVVWNNGPSSALGIKVDYADAPRNSQIIDWSAFRAPSVRFEFGASTLGQKICFEGNIRDSGLMPNGVLSLVMKSSTQS